ncbi:MAG: anthranilate synthase component I [bacterium]|nr:anthranilate synthase component I [bacterium]
MNPTLSRSTPADAERYRLCWTVRPADLYTPVRVYQSLRAAGHHGCLLESVEGPARLARYSFVAVDPSASFRGASSGSRLTANAGAERPVSEQSWEGPAHLALREVVAQHAAPAPPPGLPPFCGGWIGFFSYEWASSLEPRVPRAAHDPHGVPEATFDLYRDIVAFDHAAQKLYVVVACEDGAAGHAAALERAERVGTDLDAPLGAPQAFRLLDPEPRSCTSREDFLAGVGELKRAIAQGEIFQAVLSQRFEQRFEGDEFTLYRVLRLTNPAPHMFFFEADGRVLVGSSPERLVSVQDGHVQVVPIAGTRPRSDDPDEDDRLGAELRADPKERAEHDMLVDLARNDVGRVARIGTVRVKEHATLELFQRVQHLVSRVEAALADDRDGIDALVASFPAGTVSGAPKVRAMELLAGLERDTRGAYAGAFGYIDGSGNLDVAITIRTLVVENGAIHFQAGAGIVFDSDPEKEYMETLHKSRALFEAVELAASPAFQPAVDPSEATT